MAKPARNAKDLHRPLTEADNLDEVIAWREVRTVTGNLTLHYDRMLLLLEPTLFARGLVRKKVDVVNYPDGRFAVQFEGVSGAFKVFDKIQTVAPGTIVENKRLGAALAMVKEHQATYAPNPPALRSPARQRPPNNLEAPGDAHEEPAAPAVWQPHPSWLRPTDARPHRSLLGAGDGLKGCAARTGKPAAALDPLARTPRLAVMPFRASCVRKLWVSSLLCAMECHFYLALTLCVSPR